MSVQTNDAVARIRGVALPPDGHSRSVITTGKLAVSLDARMVKVAGRRVHLTKKEYQMLELLALRKGTTLTMEMFMNHLYCGKVEPKRKIIHVFMCKLRKKLAAATSGDTYIETVWGSGYALFDPESEEAA